MRGNAGPGARIRGHGDYITDVIGRPQTEVGRAARAAGKFLGGRVGSLFGSRGADIGSMLGGGAAQTIARLFGHGDYTVVKNNSVIQGQAVASFQNGGRGLNLCHREFIANVTGSVDFTNTSYPINPAVSKTFPYLSKIAELFEEYEFRGLVFEFVTTSGVVSATSAALGSVVMATDYDSYADNFATKQQMESYQFAISTVPCQNAAHGVECDNREKTSRNLYTRTGSYKGSLLDYDFGKFQIATVGMPASYVVGELWVTYDVRLLKPRIIPGNTMTVPQSFVLTVPTTASASGYVGWMAQGSEMLAAMSLRNPSITYYDVSQGVGNYKGETLGFDPQARTLYLLAPCHLVIVVEIKAKPDQVLFLGTAGLTLTAGTIQTNGGAYSQTVGSAISFRATTYTAGLTPASATSSVVCQTTNTSDAVFGDTAKVAVFIIENTSSTWGTNNTQNLADFAWSPSQGAMRVFDATSAVVANAPVDAYYRIYDILA